MPSRLSRRQFVEQMLILAAPSAAIGCGTILHPERRGQAAGPLDWKIVALDAVGLLFFFVPGVIAFAVDFNNGTIYLPEHQQAQTSQSSRKLHTRQLRRQQSLVTELETTVSEHLQRDITLTPGQYQTEPLTEVADFWSVYDRRQSLDLG